MIDEIIKIEETLEVLGIKKRLDKAEKQIWTPSGVRTVNGEEPDDRGDITVSAGGVGVEADPIYLASEAALFVAGDAAKLLGIATGAEVNVQSDWNQANNALDDFIKNKPSIPTQYTDEMAQDAVGGILTNTGNVQFVYDDGTPKITASVDLSGKEAILIHQIVATLPAVAGAKCRVRVPMAGTITSAIITGDISGSAVVDIWKDTTANYPPSVADTITASAKPTLSTQSLVTDSTLTGWTKTLTTGDWLVFSVDSCDVLSDIQVTLIYTRN